MVLYIFGVTSVLSYPLVCVRTQQKKKKRRKLEEMLLNVPNYRVRLNVAVQQEVIFFSFMQRWMKKNQRAHCFIAGSYALHTFMRSIGLTKHTLDHGFVPNDVDIYVTVDDKFTIMLMLCHFQIKHPMYKIESLRFYKTYSGMFLRSQISGILELQLSHKFFLKTIKVQIIMLWSGYRLSVFQVAQSVIGAYDISVCKVAMVSGANPMMFYFKDGQDALDIDTLRYSFRFRDGHSNEKALSRIAKYSSRGFALDRIFLENHGLLYCFPGSLSVKSLRV